MEIRAIFGFAIVLEPLMRMRRLLALSLLLMMAVLSPALADPPIPALTGRVVDDADVLSTATVDAISAKLQGYEAATTNQVVVVTLPDLKGYPIEDWGLALGRGWGLGQKGHPDRGAEGPPAPDRGRVRARRRAARRYCRPDHPD
ncbi:MAG TPA: TPM domain-containing protein, partial [Dongiaceae bacterium]|nr:TPM domain-containing protein [Dongiaceae bacterium]